MIHTVSTKIGDLEFSIEIGRMAKQAGGAAFVRYGDTCVLVTACGNVEPKPNASFLPLTCDYRENQYSAGKIPGGFFKREGRPTEKEILTSRLIDRPLRPLFPDNYTCETQVIALVVSADPENNPDMLALTGASTALLCSEIPFTTPVAAIRVGMVDDKFIANPTYEQMKTSRLNLIVAGSEEAIVMVEAGAREVSEEHIVEALQFAHQQIKLLIGLQRQLFEKIHPSKRTVEPRAMDQALYNEIEAKASSTIREAFGTRPKLAYEAKMEAARQALVESYPAEGLERRAEAGRLFDTAMENIFRKDLLEASKRPDGRRFDEIRQITSEVGLLPRTHGSALFTRGETQALVITTLGTGDDEQRMDELTGESKKKFMLHYNFPPFSVGEVAFLRGPGRREIGHGALAERAIAPVLPDDDKFPYTIRIVSDILESNGSSSMASICGGIMSLMDAGAPIKAPVAGVAMGLVKEGERYAILSDIAGAEDHYGDMDFKVAGTARGITALQMDIKITGITSAILSEALAQAKAGRLYILEKMLETISAPRAEVALHAPRIFTMRIPIDKIGGVIGPGGKMIRSIIERTGVKIDIEDDGRVNIASTDTESAEKARQIIQELTATAEINKVYLGKVTRVVDFGAFVEIFANTEGLLHISEFAEHRIKDIRDECKVGDQIMVKVLSIEPPNKIRLSRKAVLRDQRGAAGTVQQ